MKKFRIAHIFSGIGGKGLGAARAIARHGDIEASFETIGGIDFDPLACKDFEMLVGAPALCADVHELEPADLLRFFGPDAPDAIMMSPPCKGFSGLLSAKRAAEPKYQKMNALMERALFLVLSSWPTPPKLIFVENVPRIASRGKDTIRRCIAMGHAHGYAIAEGTHDCGELGNLAQHRRRYFQLWRHRAQMPQVVYEPAKQRVRACGEVLGPLPMPGDVEAGGPMHSVPRLSWRNWLRLALIPAGGDWRDLPGVLADGQKRREKFRRDPVTAWATPAETVTGPGGSASTNVADPRFTNIMHMSGWDDPARTVVGARRPGGGAPSVADPRISTHGRYRIMTLAEALALDLPLDRPPPWIPIIIAADGTWHRPLTTLELAVLQSFPALFRGAPLVLAGTSHTRWREAIGNAVPPDAAERIAEQLLRSLLLSALGAFALDNNDIWVAPQEALVA